MKKNLKKKRLRNRSLTMKKKFKKKKTPSLLPLFLAHVK
jgi:hypothetical protein